MIDTTEETTETIEIKNNDVFRFRYDPAKKEVPFMPYHCFDGTLKAEEWGDGSIILRDTYWSGGSDNRWFTPEEAMDRGDLEFICNLDEVDPIKKHDLVYYDDDDIFVLYIHAGYRNEYYLRRGAERSKDKMIATLDEQEEDARRAISSAERTLEEVAEKRALLESGDTSIWL